MDGGERLVEFGHEARWAGAELHGVAEEDDEAKGAEAEDEEDEPRGDVDGNHGPYGAREDAETLVGDEDHLLVDSV